MWSAINVIIPKKLTGEKSVIFLVIPYRTLVINEGTNKSEITNNSTLTLVPTCLYNVIDWKNEKDMQKAYTLNSTKVG